MHFFDYRDDDFCCEGVTLDRVATEVGTPTYVYSRATLLRHLRVFHEAFGQRPHLVCFSTKANSNLAVLRTLREGGAGFDVVSGGELFRVLRAGADPRQVVFSGVGKRPEEIREALAAGILMLNVESHGELLEVERAAAALGTSARIALRVNPEVDARTHPYIATGLKQHKFGIPLADARAEYDFAATLPHLEVCGLDCHIGSQLTTVQPISDAVARVLELYRELRAASFDLRYLDVGGGLGIRYDTEQPPAPPAAVVAVMDRARDEGLTLICEPGRSIVGNAGVLLTRVLYVKRAAGKTFVVVDAAMNDLLRPAFYGAFHEIRPVQRRAAALIRADVVGPVCESGDFLARDRELAEPHPGDLLAVMSAGAYGFTMASNYNARPRAAEIMCAGEDFTVVRRRETYVDLVRGEE
ncbi:MAG: diaminopimelate decarboxylase [Deltaproteobacteria bacterium]|nr:diaminopimelate decarboxylase [Deltaproteobacteria bacterium]